VVTRRIVGKEEKRGRTPFFFPFFSCPSRASSARAWGEGGGSKELESPPFPLLFFPFFLSSSSSFSPAEIARNPMMEGAKSGVYWERRSRRIIFLLPSFSLSPFSPSLLSLLPGRQHVPHRSRGRRIEKTEENGTILSSLLSLFSRLPLHAALGAARGGWEWEGEEEIEEFVLTLLFFPSSHVTSRARAPGVKG